MIPFVQKIYIKNDQLKAYTLLSPALILIVIAMAAPMLVMKLQVSILNLNGRN